MLWFRVGEQLCVVFTLLFTIGILYAILDMVTKGAKTKAMEHDPAYNGTLLIYIVMIIFQLWINFTCLFGFFVSFKVWQNNYQMDHQLRHWFMMQTRTLVRGAGKNEESTIHWLGSWCAALLGNLGVAIFAMVKGKEPQDEMSYIYEVFSRYATDKVFVASFEKYQRESSCCGIYGPDDWLMLQLRSSANSGGGGGGFQSLDYGFKTNPSTGHCHLKPPTIPMGCGKKLLEEVHIKLKTIAGLTILETVIGTCAGVLAWYCFFYWLEKEVIVIPEDEISNLIVIEPESSTSTVVDEDIYSNGGYLDPGGSLARYSHQPGSYYNPSRVARGSHYSEGFDPRRSGSGNNHHGSGSHPHYHSRESQRSPSRFQEYSSARQSHGSGQAHQNPGHLPSKNVASNAPPPIKTTAFNSKSKSKAVKDAAPSTSYAPSAMQTTLKYSSKVTKGPALVTSNPPPPKKTTFKFNSKSKSKANRDSASKSSHAPSSVKTTLFNSKSKSRAKQESPVRLPSPVSHATNLVYMSKSTERRERMLSAAGPFDANSRFKQDSVRIPNHTSYIKPHYAGYASIVGSRRTEIVAHVNPILHNHNPHEPHKKHSKNHQLHKQELALGGKVLGEMHVDHTKDPDPMNPADDIAKGEKGHQDHHATVALVKNKKAPKPKTIIPKKGAAHHGQTGHLAEDIAEMSGKKAKKLIDDVILPVEHNPPPTLGHGGYLAAHKKHAGYMNKGDEDSGMPPGVHLVNNGKEISAPSIDGSEAQNLIETMITPVAVNHNAKGAPEIKPHYAGTPPHHHDNHGHYLPEGGPGQHNRAHYLPGAHENAHYLQGAHENAHYLPGAHENAHYLPGMHEKAHYLQGMHEGGHYLGGSEEHHPGMHDNNHYLGGSEEHHPGMHDNNHYLGGSMEHHNKGSHEHSRYLNEENHHNRGSHEQGHYLGEHHTGSHEHAHYLGQNHHHTGSHEHAHYLGENHRAGSHEHAHYLGENHHGGSHDHAHYLGENHHAGSYAHAHYLGENHHGGSHEHAHYLGENHHGGSHEHAHYLGETHHGGSHEHAHYLGENHPAGSHAHAHYLGENHHGGSHEHAHYLEENHHGGSHEHAHYLGETHHGGSHEHAHYLGENHPHPGSHDHGNYIHEDIHHHGENHEHGHLGHHRNEGSHAHGLSNHAYHHGQRDTEAHILYKNPIPIDDTD